MPSGSTKAGARPEAPGRLPHGGGERHRIVGVDALTGGEHRLALGEGLLAHGEVEEGVADVEHLRAGELAGRPQRAQAGLHGRRRLRRDGGWRSGGRRRRASAAGTTSVTSPISRARRGADALVVAQQRHAHDLAEGHVVQHQRGLEHRRHAVGDVGVEEGGVVGGHEDVGLAEQVEGAPAGHAVDRRRSPASSTRCCAGPRRRARVAVGERVERVLDAAVGRHLGAVDARAEGLLARGRHARSPARRRPRGRGPTSRPSRRTSRW